jgi:hypothetical protein
MKQFWRTRRKVLLGFLISFGVFLLFNLVIFHLRYGNPITLVLKIPFALLLPSFWANDPTLRAFNYLITLIPLTGMLFALIQPRNTNMLAVAHIALVLYWTHVFFTIAP